MSKPAGSTSRKNRSTSEVGVSTEQPPARSALRGSLQALTYAEQVEAVRPDHRFPTPPLPTASVQMATDPKAAGEGGGEVVVPVKMGGQAHEVRVDPQAPQSVDIVSGSRQDLFQLIERADQAIAQQEHTPEQSQARSDLAEVKKTTLVFQQTVMGQKDHGAYSLPTLEKVATTYTINSLDELPAVLAANAGKNLMTFTHGGVEYKVGMRSGLRLEDDTSEAIKAILFQLWSEFSPRYQAARALQSRLQKEYEWWGKGSPFRGLLEFFGSTAIHMPKNDDIDLAVEAASQYYNTLHAIYSGAQGTVEELQQVLGQAQLFRDFMASLDKASSYFLRQQDAHGIITEKSVKSVLKTALKYGVVWAFGAGTVALVGKLEDLSGAGQLFQKLVAHAVGGIAQEGIARIVDGAEHEYQPLLNITVHSGLASELSKFVVGGDKSLFTWVKSELPADVVQWFKGNGSAVEDELGKWFLAEANGYVTSKLSGMLTKAFDKPNQAPDDALAAFSKELFNDGVTKTLKSRLIKRAKKEAKTTVKGALSGPQGPAGKPGGQA